MNSASFQFSRMIGAFAFVICAGALSGETSAIAQKAKTPETLTPEQVDAAFRAVHAFGCVNTGYSWKEQSPDGGAGKVKRRSGSSSSKDRLPPIPREAVDAARFVYLSHGNGHDSFALGFPTKTGDGDLSRLIYNSAKFAMDFRSRLTAKSISSSTLP